MPERNAMVELRVGSSEGVDVAGLTGKAIQIAIDAAALRGGGTVRVMPGEYVLEDSIRMRSNVTLIGERDGALLRRGPLDWSRLAVDADIGEDVIVPEDSSKFRAGMGVCTWDEKSGWAMTGYPAPMTVAAVVAGELRLGDCMTADRTAERGGRVVNHFPMILCERVDNVTVDGFTVEAQVDDPDGVLARLESAAVLSTWSRRVTFRNLKVLHGRCDGIVFGKACRDWVVEDCESAENGDFGIHPGSHSVHGAIRRCHVHHNGRDGFYICWGVRYSVFEDNHIHHNARVGFTIGHKDTNNLIARNHIHDNGLYGMLFRRKTEPNGPHRNVVRDNLIENNGTRCRPEDVSAAIRRIAGDSPVGCGVRIEGMTHDLTFLGNTIRETRPAETATQRHAFYLGKGVKRVTMRENVISGHPEEAIVDESGGGGKWE